jgi:hypothetical protein
MLSKLFGEFLLLVISFFLIFLLLLHSCLLNDRECLWFSIRKILFSSLFTRPPLISDDEQMTPFRMYNSRLNSTPINNNETHRSAIFTTLHSERCFHEKGFICLDYIFIIFSFACILSVILLASPIHACFTAYIDMIFAWMVARIDNEEESCFLLIFFSISNLIFSSTDSIHRQSINVLIQRWHQRVVWQFIIFQQLWVH